jgi:hypothetical protein
VSKVFQNNLQENPAAFRLVPTFLQRMLHIGAKSQKLFRFGLLNQFGISFSTNFSTDLLKTYFDGQKSLKQSSGRSETWKGHSLRLPGKKDSKQLELLTRRRQNILGEDCLYALWVDRIPTA